MVDRIILGGYDEFGNPDPYMVTFILYGGFIQDDLSSESESGFMKMMEFDLEYDHYLYNREKEVNLEKTLLKTAKVLVGNKTER